MRHIALLGLALLSACSSMPAGDPDAGRYDRLVIVGTNDFHGYLRPVENELGGERVLIGGAEWFAGYVNILKEKFGDHLILLDGGDMWQGTIESNLFQGASVVAFYNHLPYRAVALGNHEFDYGPEASAGKDRLGALRARMRESRFPYVQANIFWGKAGKPWREANLFPSVLVEAGGYKVGIIGLTTTNTKNTTFPTNVAELDFRDFRQPTLEEARKLREQGADLVLIATHEGGEKPGEPIHDLLHTIPRGTIDAVVSGHTHTRVQEFVNGVPVIQSRARGLYFGRIDLFVDKASRRVDPSRTVIHDTRFICGNWFRTQQTCDHKIAKDAIDEGKALASDFVPLRPAIYEGVEVKPDLAVRATLEPYLAKADEKRRERLGTANADFDWYPTGESQMGTLIIDSFRYRFPEAKAILMNGGGIRRRLFRGPVTYGDLYEVSPFDNYAVLVKVTGRQLKDMVRVLVAGVHQVPALWGVRATYFDREDPAFDRDVNGDGKKEKWERDRLHPEHGLVWEKSGRPVRDGEEFWLATIDYLAAGGDHLGHVFRGIPASRRRYFEQGPRDLMAEYLRKHPGIRLPRTGEMRLNPIK